MILDSEEQRQFLIKIIESVPLNGTLQGMTQAVTELSKILQAVQKAKVATIDQPNPSMG